MKDFTKGPVVCPLMLFALPIALGVVFQRFYNLFDIMLVGRYIDTNALAAVGSSGIIFNLFINLGWGFASGFGIVIGQKFGAKDETGLKMAIAGAYLYSVVISVFLSIIGLVFINPILRAIQVPASLFPQAKAYLSILTAGLIVTIMYNVFTSILRALGDSLSPLVFLIISVSLNFCFDILFIVVLKKGVAGAAAATVIAQGVSVLLTFCFGILRRPVLRLKPGDFHISKSITKELFSQGLSMSLMLSVVDIGSVVLQAGINGLGPDLIAGYTAGRKWLELGMIPGAAFSVSAAAYVSQNYGAREYGRIKKGVFSLVLIGWICATAFILVSVFLGRTLVMVITGSDAEASVIANGLKYLRTGVPFYYSLFVLVIVRSSLQGINRKKAPLAASGIELAVKIISTFVLIPVLGYTAICFCEPVIWTLGALWVVPLFMVSIRRIMQEKTALLEQDMEKNV